MFPEPTESLSIGFPMDSIWTQKSKLKYICTKNQLANVSTKGKFTRNEGKHFRSVECHEKDSGEQRITTKSKPMMNVVARCSERE